MFLAMIAYGLGSGYWGKADTQEEALAVARRKGGMDRTPKKGWGVWRVSDDASVDEMGDIHSTFEPIEVEVHL